MLHVRAPNRAAPDGSPWNSTDVENGRRLVSLLIEEGFVKAEIEVKPGVFKPTLEFLAPYQIASPAWSHRRPWTMKIWAPGGGKTLGAFLTAMVQAYATLSPWAIAAPAKARNNVWGRQLERYAGERVSWASVTPESLRRKSYVPIKDHLDHCRSNKLLPTYIIGTESLPDYWKELVPVRPGVLTFDEIHTLSDRKRWEQKPGKDGKRELSLRKNRAASAWELSKLPSIFFREGLTATPMGSGLPRSLYAQLTLLDLSGWGSYWDFSKRYCLSPETPVLRANGEYAAISAVNVGDQVVGWESKGYRVAQPATVLWKGERQAECVAVYFRSGKQVICSVDHHWLVETRADRKVQYRPITLQPAADRRTKTVDFLLQAAHTPEEWTIDAQYKLGYIHGFVDGDGWYRIKEPKFPTRRAARDAGCSYYGGRSYCVAAACKDLEPITRLHQFGLELGFEPCTIRLRRSGLYSVGFYRKKHYEALTMRDKLQGQDSNYRRGWLAGIFDAEGTDQTIAQCKKVNPEVYSRIAEYLDSFGFDITLSEEAVSFSGGGWELIRFYDAVRPALERKRLHQWHKAKNSRHKDRCRGLKLSLKRDDILRVEYIGVRPVISIQTSTGNYIANGYASKNCDAHEHAELGFMVDTGATNLEELRARASFFVHEVSYQESHGHLPPLRWEVYEVEQGRQGKPTGKRELEREIGRGGPDAKMELAIALAASRKEKAAIEDMLEVVRWGQKVVIFTIRHHLCERLQTQLVEALKRAKLDVPVFWGHGGHSQKFRDEQFEGFISAPGAAVFNGTGDAWGTAVDGFQCAHLAQILGFPWTPTQLDQWKGRFDRPEEGKTEGTVVRFYYAAGTIEDKVISRLVERIGNIEQFMSADSLKGAAAKLNQREDDEAFRKKMIAWALSSGGSDDE